MALGTVKVENDFISLNRWHLDVNTFDEGSFILGWTAIRVLLYDMWKRKSFPGIVISTGVWWTLTIVPRI